MKVKAKRFGIWMIGASGGIGATVALGLAALSRRLIKTTGLVTALAEFDSADLCDAGKLVVGGHEIRAQTLLESVRSIHAESKVIPREIIEKCAQALRRTQHNIRPGIILGAIRKIRSIADAACVRRADSPASAVRLVRNDLRAFRRQHRLDHVVVVNVASSEPPLKASPAHRSYSALAKAMNRKGSTVLPTSALYALGAFAADCSYVNFTPSAGVRIPAILEFAEQRDVLYMGRDGKTGETLLKSVLAPMFATRNLRLHSWIGHNVLGNRDGEILSDPAVKASKIRSKDRLVSRIVGYEPHTQTSIEYVPSLRDWKVAWDFIHFEGFLDTKMNVQFVWTGSDSMLAAPLIIDLVRLTALDYAAGRRGRMEHLACFFKDPQGVEEHEYFRQWQHLLEHVDSIAASART